jgi:hypothetical protein
MQKSAGNPTDLVKALTAKKGDRHWILGIHGRFRLPDPSQASMFA